MSTLAITMKGEMKERDPRMIRFPKDQCQMIQFRDNTVKIMPPKSHSQGNLDKREEYMT